MATLPNTNAVGKKRPELQAITHLLLLMKFQELLHPDIFTRTRRYS